MDLPVLCRLCGGGRIENKDLRLEKAFGVSSYRRDRIGVRAGKTVPGQNKYAAVDFHHWISDLPGSLRISHRTGLPQGESPWRTGEADIPEPVWKIREGDGMEPGNYHAFAASSGSRAGSCMGSHNRPSDGADLSDMAEFSHTK